MLDLFNKATVTIKTPYGDTDPLFSSNFVKQGTVLGPVLNNCSLNKLSTDSIGYNFGSVQTKSMEFVDELADPNRDKQSALASNAVLQAIQHEKRLTFSAEKCELLKINSKDDTCLKVNGRSMKQVDVACYLGDHFNRQGNNSDLCEERVTKAKDTITELCSLCKGINMENKQIETMLLLYKTVFIPRLIYNCEAWSNLTPKDYLTLQAPQLTYLWNILEVSKATPIAAMYLELGILPVRYEIEMRQLLFLKHLLDKKHVDPCLRTYTEMLKFENETNWANNVLGLRRDYLPNLPMNDDNIKKMSVSHWKYFVKSAIFKEALLQLQVELSSNRKTNHITYQHFSLKPNDYLLQLPSHLARLVFKAKTRTSDIRINCKRKCKNGLHCPFCSEYDEKFEHIFKCRTQST